MQQANQIKNSKLKKLLSQLLCLQEVKDLDEQSLIEILRSSAEAKNLRDVAQTAATFGELLEQAGSVLASQSDSHILDAAKERSDTYIKGLIESGDLLSAQQICEALRITPQALVEAVNDHRMFFMRFRGENFYPQFFADPSLDRRQIEQVCKMLGNLGGASKWMFFARPKQSLMRRTPVEALRAGEFESVLKAAQGFVER